MNTIKSINKQTKYYVSMTDKFLSGWGQAENKISKYVIECDTYNEAQIVYNNALNRSEMKHINICMNKPRYNSKYYQVDYNDKTGVSSFFIPNYFKNKKSV
jgi:hypothetical protein